jgi:hypothetical protein
MAHLATEAALDTYVFCLCEHDPIHMDGLLSMWREYGRKGNGAALVFNTQKWAAAGSKDTELGVKMEPEVGHGATEIYPRVQA